MSLFILISTVTLACLIWWVCLTHGVYGPFIYTDKRKPCVSIHLSILRTPRNPEKIYSILKSLKCCLKELEKRGHGHVHMKSHLLNDKSIETFKKIISRSGYSIIKIELHDTPIKDRILIPVSMLIFKAKLLKTNKKSYEIAIQLNHNDV